MLESCMLEQDQFICETVPRYIRSSNFNRRVICVQVNKAQPKEGLWKEVDEKLTKEAACFGGGGGPGYHSGS